MAIENLDSYKNHPVIAEDPGLQQVLSLFDLISSIPRPSLGEAKVREALAKIAKEKGWNVLQDATGNMAFKIAATTGKENVTELILQGHLDIVTKKNNRDLPRVAQIVDKGNDGEEQGLWMQTKDQKMTLGADNGIGVCIALAAMMDSDLEHGPVTILLTVNEETGMTGAKGLDPKLLPEVGIILNLDSEEGAQEICIGSAGGADIGASFPIGEREKIPNGYEIFGLNLTDFPGGHSGLKIHEGRGNAIQSMAILLGAIQMEAGDLRLISIDGGEGRNVIAHESSATIAIPKSKVTKVKKLVNDFIQNLGSDKTELSGKLSKEYAKNVKVDLVDLHSSPVIEEVIKCSIGAVNSDLRDKILQLLQNLPCGPLESTEVPHAAKLVTISNNLGVVSTNKKTIEILSMARGAEIEKLKATILTIKTMMVDAGGRLNKKCTEPTNGWLENPLVSPAVLLLSEAVKELVGSVKLMAYHAGLEAGIVSEKALGQMSAVAYGPLIKGAHSKEERTELKSIGQALRVVKRTLQSSLLATQISL